MKSLLISFFSVIVLFSMVSCDNEGTGEGIEYQSYLTGTYSNHDESNKNKLSLKYNDVELEKKEAIFHTSDKDMKIGKISLSNVIDGEKETVIDNVQLNLNEKEGRLYFEGLYTSRSDKKINYSGFVTLNLLSIQLSDSNQ